VEVIMTSVKVAITLNRDTLRRVDNLVKQRTFPNRSRAIQIALQEKIDRVEGNRLAAECAKLDPAFEKAMAEEGLGEDAEACLLEKRKNGRPRAHVMAAYQGSHEKYAGLYQKLAR
jgi:Arc/MetJ-type ribon-helix-helix transcriptional regulator